MDYRSVAEQVYESIGKKENIVSAAHCATRLCLVIADNKKCKKEVLENIEGVKGVFEAAGQLQIIFGTGTVNKVFDEFVKISGVTGASKEEVKQAAASKQNILKRLIKTLGDVFVPIIPAIVASGLLMGLLMGLLEGLSQVFPAMANSGSYTIIHLFSNAAFVFLPVLIATSAAKVFGGNIFLGSVIGMIMIHTDLMNAWSVATAEAVPQAEAWFGLYKINLVGYQGHVIPVVIAVWFMCLIEKKLHKIVPEMIDLFVTPLVTVLVTGYCTLTIIGPVFSWIENGVLGGVGYLLTLPLGLGSALAGALYAPTVVAGITGVGATAYGITGLFGYLITTKYVLAYTLVILVAAGSAFALSWLMFKEEKKEGKAVEEKVEAEAADAETREPFICREDVVYSPIKGTAIPLTEVNDATFAGEILGKGLAIVPEEGTVYAPFDGTVEMVFDTKHAIGLSNGHGIELLIHVGLNTVELNGKYYEALVETGDMITAGQKLLTFDIDAIKAAGYDMTTPVIVTNIDNFEDAQMEKSGKVQVLDPVLTVK